MKGKQKSWISIERCNEASKLNNYSIRVEKVWNQKNILNL